MDTSLATKDVIDRIESRADKAVVTAIDSRVTDLEAKMKDALAEPADDPAGEAVLKKGFMDDIMSFEIWGIPVGQAVLGGFVAIFASELIDGFMANQPPWQRGLAKLGGAAVAGLWGKRILGSTGAKAVALLLTFDAMRDFTPVDAWAKQLAEKISGTLTTAGLADTSNRRAAPVNTNTGARANAGQSFYSQALGG